MADIYKNGVLVQHMNNANIPNNEWKKQAGINPKNNQPERTCPPSLKEEMRKLIRIQDEQDAVNSFQWYNLPCNITSEELERLLYYHGNLAFFYMKEIDQFFFMKYALDGTIDFYGRFNQIHPVPVSGGTTDQEKDAIKAQEKMLSNFKYKVQHDIKLDELTLEDLDTTAVLLSDYSKQRGQTIIPRQQLQESIIDIESDIPCYLRTSLKNSTGVLGMRVNDQGAYSNVLAANESLDNAALTGRRMVPVISNIDFQDLTEGSVAKSAEYLEALQAIDNLRLGFHGIQNGGLFQKKSHMLETEEMMNTGKANSALQDRQWNRQHFCDIVNSVWGLGIWCEPKENALGADINMDGQENQNDGPETVDNGSMETEGDANE